MLLVVWLKITFSEPELNISQLYSFLTSGYQVLFLSIYYNYTVMHNTYKNPMLNYNWAILGDMFRPLNGHPQANLHNIVKVP